MRLGELLDESVIKIGLRSRDKDGCIGELLDVLAAGRLPDRAGALEAILRRERQGSTGIGKGVAVPHGKHASILRLTAALGTSAEGIAFESIDGKPVHLVILLLARANEPGPHIRALAAIARLVTTDDVCGRIVAAMNARQVLDIIEEVESPTRNLPCIW